MEYRSCYPNSKRASETLCASYVKEYGVRALVARLSHVYGPTMTESDNRVVSDFIRRGKQGRPVVLKSTGSTVRSYTYVLDVCSGLLEIKKNGIAGEAYNIADELRSLSDYNGKYKVLSIGDNQSTLAKQIMCEVDDAGLALEFKGRLSHDVTIGMLAKSDVVICASREETMSAVIIEGMMLGKICITTDNTGIADYIVDGINGFIYNASDAQSLANKMMYIMENYNDLSSIKSNARETYEKYFSMTSFAGEIIKLLE